MKHPNWYDAFIRDVKTKFNGSLVSWYKDAYYKMGLGCSGLYGVGIVDTIKYVELHEDEVLRDLE